MKGRKERSVPRDLHELPKLRDSLSYLYVERCRIEQNELAIELWDAHGRTPVPVASLSLLMLGPGTAITHAAGKALADHGCTVLWCGEENVRFYAAGLGETRKAYRLMHQARCVCDEEKHREVAWRMYELRFGYRLERDISVNEMRGMEGARMRDAYAEAADIYGVRWSGRRYDRSNWAHADPINRALSAANSCMYGICHSAIVAGGYSPALGFIHTGKQLSFVYDVGDLYKTEITIPLAFSVTAESPKEVEERVRYSCRERFRQARLLKRILSEIDGLLALPDDEPSTDDDLDSDPAMPAKLWEDLWAEPLEA
jgi:CRISPR-associated protein Cas1